MPLASIVPQDLCQNYLKIMKNFNKVFRTAEGIILTKISEKEIFGFTGNYLSVVNNQAIAVVDGQEIAVPAVLFNEIGVEYHFVDYYQHGLKMAKKHGIYYAVKQEPIRVWKNVKPGECIKTIIDGYEEHSMELDDSKVAAQNVIKNEFYAIPKEVLEKKYKFDHSEFDYDLYVPKSDAVSHWAYSDVNTFGVLWGGLEFLTTPMINITDESDCYGCNYIVWWGNDGRLSSYKVLGYFRACGQLFYERPMAEPKSVLEASFEPPKCLAC